MAMKTCSRCGDSKPIEEFSPRPDRPGAYRSHCKVCRSTDAKGHARRINRQYGISADKYNELAKNGCNICGVPGGSRRLAVDHCHHTGVVRGLLCDACNRALGLMSDDPELLRLAANYLENPPAACLPTKS